MSNLRLIPVVVFAAFCLLALKTIGFLGDGASGGNSWGLDSQVWDRLAGNMLGDADPVVTGATPEKKASPPMAALPKGAPSADDKAAKSEMPAGAEGTERVLIERLQERRQELEARARDLEMRESLLKAAEKQLDSRLGEMKGVEAEAGEASDRIKSLVVMYESMGPKEAARIFDRLDPRTLVGLVNHMNPRKVSEIMAKMQPEAAERMTLELARGRNPAERALPATDLRRIDTNKPR